VFRHHLDGVERADSISLSPHKWLLTCLDCTCLWVRNARQLRDACSSEFLRNDASESGAVSNLKDMQVALGRRFRGLKIWMVMRTYGAARLQEHVRSDVAMAEAFEGRVRATERLIRGRRAEEVCSPLLQDQATQRQRRIAGRRTVSSWSG
jgi:aromatic-L-amino-acid/L-tryptophan decarboxylase